MKFQKYFFCFEEEYLHIKFEFNLSDKHFFCPEIKIPERNFYNWKQMSDCQLETLAFHIGMVELISYWKCACPPKVIIEPFLLNDEQIQWWKKLYFNGLGEFFYLNGIETTQSDFMQIECTSDKIFSKVDMQLSDKVLIPVGGGKDSVVTLELLKNEMSAIPLIVNPREASSECAKTAGFSENKTAIVRRTIDSNLLKLNEQGFLNGHTPFSALLAFVSILVAFGSRSKFIALSNESSANESTVPDSNINHQYSKSIEFEEDFRRYISKYINNNIQYFSFLRPLNELQIARLFSRCNSYFHVFKSCNVGSKTDSWCGKCPKCLFTWIALSPFISQQKLESIFGKNLLNDNELLPILQQLDGTAKVKPFECVGTVTEVKAGLNFIIKHNKNLENTIVKNLSYKEGFSVDELVNLFDNHHFLPKQFEHILKSNLND